jgi:phosphohistidine swiveling domain-containing protein
MKRQLEKKETSKIQNKQEIIPVFSRPFSLLRMQFLRRGEYEGIKRMTGGNFCFNPIFVYYPDIGMTAYYNNSLDDQRPQFMVEYLNENVADLRKNIEKAKKACSFLEAAVKSRKINDPREILDKNFLMQPINSLGNLVGRVPFVSKEVLDIFKSFRYDYDTLNYELEKILLEEGTRRVPEKFKNDVAILDFDELFNGKKPVNLDIRRRGFIYYEDKIIINSLDNFLKSNNFFIKKNNIPKRSDEIKGNVAYKGSAKGEVKKVYTKKDFDKFNEGDILVSTMTIPDFMPIMKKAAAIVTDEGGITCHAAIVARELKKSCIIGTKIATQVLHDGDLVEVDADRGIVKIIKKKK